MVDEDGGVSGMMMMKELEEFSVGLMTWYGQQLFASSQRGLRKYEREYNRAMREDMGQNLEEYRGEISE